MRRQFLILALTATAPCSPLLAQTGEHPLVTALDSELVFLARAQTGYHREHGRYAASTFDLGWMDDTDTDNDSIKVRIVSATRDGWSAVVTATTAPGLRCTRSEGTAPVLLPGEGPPFRCAGLNGLPPYESDPVPTPAPNIEAEADVAPGVDHCDYDARKVDRAGKVVYQFVVDTNGQVERGGLRVIEAKNFRTILDGMYIVTHCRYHPGMSKGTRVRVLVRQAVTLQ